jgi:hypothetical protein
LTTSLYRFPTAAENLWPQAYGSKYDASYKDRGEVAAGSMVCQGNIGLVDAQRNFAVNWIEWCKQLIGDSQ